MNVVYVCCLCVYLCTYGLIDWCMYEGPPVVLVLVAGRPRLFNNPSLLTRVQAVLHAHLPGPAGGRAIVETILGINAPSGRLPYTYPKYVADTPYPYYHTPGDACKAHACEVCYYHCLLCAVCCLLWGVLYLSMYTHITCNTANIYKWLDNYRPVTSVTVLDYSHSPMQQHLQHCHQHQWHNSYL